MASAMQNACVASTSPLGTARVSMCSNSPNPLLVPPTRSGSEAASLPGGVGGAGAAVATILNVDRASSHVGGRGDGMRREWNFTLTFQHQAARLSLQCAPQWEPTFIDPETAGYPSTEKLKSNGLAFALMPVLRYTDLSAVVSGGGGGGGNTIANANATSMNAGISQHMSCSPHPQPGEMGRASGSFGGALAESDAGEWWVEKAKHVETWYACVEAGTTLSNFCRRCVQHVLTDPLVVSIDGDTALMQLTLGHKLACPFALCGRYRSFHFRFRLHDRSQLMNDAAYAIGTVVGQRGYLILVRCAEEEELEGYLRRLFLPYYTSLSKLALDMDVSYGAVASELLRDQQTRFGELAYADQDGAVAFSLPMYPMRCKPDFSPAKTVGVGSIACMTLELGVFERVFEDPTVAEATGMAKYKVNQVVLCLDVEDVVRMGYPNVLSTDQYSELKINRLLEVFPDASLVSQQPTTVMLGGKAGRGYTATFSYEPMQCIAKAMLVATLIDGYGVTALYLTRLGGGSFDAYLYLFEQLLRAVRYLPHSSQQASLRLSRHRAPNIRLLETDLRVAYAVDGAAVARTVTAPPPAAAGADGGSRKAAADGDGDGDAAAAIADGASTSEAEAAASRATATTHYRPAEPRNKVRERHAKLMREAASDGKVPEGSIILQVPVELGGLPRHRQNSVAGTGGNRGHSTSHANALSGGGGRGPTNMRGPDDGADGLPTLPTSLPLRSTACPRSMAALTTTVSEGLLGDSDDGGRALAEPLSHSRRCSATTHPQAMSTDLFNASGYADYYGNEDARLGLWGTPTTGTNPGVTCAGGIGSGGMVNGVGAGGGGGGGAPLHPHAFMNRASAADTDGDDLFSLHSESLISVTAIPRLVAMREQAAMFATESAEGLGEGYETATSGASGAGGANAGARVGTAAWAASPRDGLTTHRSVLVAAAGTASLEGSRSSSVGSRGFADDVSSHEGGRLLPDHRRRLSAGGDGAPSDRHPFDGTDDADTSADPFHEPGDSVFSDSAAPRGNAMIPEAEHGNGITRVHGDMAAEQIAMQRAEEEARIRRILNGGQTDFGPTGEGASKTGTGGDAVPVAAAAPTTTYVVGPSLRDVYIRCCDLQRCRPNSYLLKKLPTDPQFTSSVEEIDLTSNYLGHNGFVAVLNLLEHLPSLKRVYFNAMSLDSTDAEHMCEALARHPAVTAVEVKGNPKITLPAARFFTRMLRLNSKIRHLSLEGTRIGESVAARLEAEAARGHVGTVAAQAMRNAALGEDR